jgi:hypothetical protein
MLGCKERTFLVNFFSIYIVFSLLQQAGLVFEKGLIYLPLPLAKNIAVEVYSC